MSPQYIPSIMSMQCFEASARYLSFTKAAEELHITQSAVSKQVSHLEEILATSLFQRIRKRLQITPEGAIYLGKVRKILSEVEISTRYMLSYRGDNEVLNVNTLPTLGVRWLIPHLNGFRNSYPNICLNISSRIDLFVLEQEGIDISIYFGHGIWPKAQCIKLFDEEVIAVCSPHISPGGSLTSPLQFTDLVLLQSATRPSAWHDWFEAQGLHTENSYRGPRFETFLMSIQAARVGCGVALVPRFLVEKELREGELVIPWEFSLTNKDNAYYLAYSEHTGQVPKIKEFIQWITARIHTKPLVD